MRPVRLAVIALVGASLAACSNDITAPSSRPEGPALFDGGCRAGYMLSSGKCESKAPNPGTGKPISVSSDGCRLGYLLATGRCSQE